MICPNCKSSDNLSTQTETIATRVLEVGLFITRSKKNEKTTVTHRCLDCGHEWSGEAA